MTGGIKGSTAGTGRTQEVEGSLGPYNVMRGLKRNPSSPRIETERRGGMRDCRRGRWRKSKGRQAWPKYQKGTRKSY